MPLEDLTGPDKFIDALVNSNPLGTDPRSEGDDHIRGVKNVLQNTFPDFTEAMVGTAAAFSSLLTGQAGQPAGIFSDFTATASGRWVPSIPRAEVQGVLGLVWGAGGGGGGTGGTAGNDRSGGGGAAGDFAMSFIKGASLPWDGNDQVPYVIGNGGAGGTPSNAVAGGESWFGASNLLQAGGGNPGSSSSTAAGQGGIGRGLAVGDVTMRGGDGGYGPLLPGGAVSGGMGGEPAFFNARGQLNGEGNGVIGISPGAGGSGGARQSVSGAGTNGGAGADGGVLLIVFGGAVT